MKVLDKKIARQSQSGSAAMARFCLFNSFIFGEFILQNVPIRRRDSADDLYIWAHSALIERFFQIFR